MEASVSRNRSDISSRDTLKSRPHSFLCQGVPSGSGRMNIRASDAKTQFLTLAAALLLATWPRPTLGSDAAVLQARVPSHLIEEARQWRNPLEATPENIERGKALFQGKAFCVTCHGRDGRGLGDIAGLRGKLPRNFTDQRGRPPGPTENCSGFSKMGVRGPTWRPSSHWS